MRKIYFDPSALEDLQFWTKDSPAKSKKIIELVLESAKHPFKGKGKPEPLKFNLSGCWSRRIDREHRLVYEVTKNYIRILSCRYHY